MPVVDPLVSVGVGGEPAEGSVGSVAVVLGAPVFGLYLDFQQRVELFADEELVAEPAVERLAGSVLPRGSGVDVSRVEAGEPAPIL